MFPDASRVRFFCFSRQSRSICSRGEREVHKVAQAVEAVRSGISPLGSTKCRARFRARSLPFVFQYFPRFRLRGDEARGDMEHIYLYSFVEERRSDRWTRGDSRSAKAFESGLVARRRNCVCTDHWLRPRNRSSGYVNHDHVNIVQRTILLFLLYIYIVRRGLFLKLFSIIC